MKVNTKLSYVSPLFQGDTPISPTIKFFEDRFYLNNNEIRYKDIISVFYKCEYAKSPGSTSLLNSCNYAIKTNRGVFRFFLCSKTLEKLLNENLDVYDTTKIVPLGLFLKRWKKRNQRYETVNIADQIYKIVEKFSKINIG